MRIFAVTVLLVASAISGPNSQAAPPPGGGGGYAGPGNGHGGGAHHVGGPYRAGYGPGYGYGGWRYGYPWYGYGYGWGLGLGYGTGWALSVASPWYWGAPVYAYGVPAYYPYGYLAAAYPGLVVNEELSYVQQPQPEAAAPGPARAGTTFWYYCTQPAGYYPYVQQCSRPWVAVQPQITPPAGSAPAQ
jgi:hypothetical protein